jgi:hypothetical protein
MGGVSSVALNVGTGQNERFLHENEILHGMKDIVPFTTVLEQFWIHVLVVTIAV